MIAPRRHVAEIAMYVVVAAAWLPRAFMMTLQPMTAYVDPYFSSALRGDGTRYATETVSAVTALLYPFFPTVPLLWIAAPFVLFFIVRGPRAVRLLVVAQIFVPLVLFVLSEWAWRGGRMTGKFSSFAASWLMFVFPVAVAIVRNKALNRAPRE